MKKIHLALGSGIGNISYGGRENTAVSRWDPLVAKRFIKYGAVAGAYQDFLPGSADELRILIAQASAAGALPRYVSSA